MTEYALAWAARGFRVFPLLAGGKVPAVRDWQRRSTIDPEQIRKWWEKNPFYNVGVYCKGLCVIDVDVKGGKPGAASFFDLDIGSNTLTVRTPSGGWHYYYFSKKNTDNTAGKLGAGLDTRSHNGYVIAPGSVTEQGEYVLENDTALLEIPEEIVSRLYETKEKVEQPLVVIEEDTEAAYAIAKHWLIYSAPLSLEGDGGDHTAYGVACKLRDYGLSATAALDMLLDFWNDRCAPPWSLEELQAKVTNAYQYAQNPAGSASPAIEFAGVEMPPEPPRKRSKWIDAGDPINLNQQWLFYERLPRVGTALLVAPSGAGKTFLTARLAACLAKGEEFFGVKPDEECAAIILSGEGVGGMPNRLRVLGGKIPVSAVSVSTLGDSTALREAIEDIVAKAKDLKEKYGKRLGMIVIDTLASVGLLADENSNTDCAKAVKALEQISARLDCLVVVTHHPPKNGTGARGGSALHAGFDTVFEIFHTDANPVRYVECTKGRDAPTGKWGSFTLQRHVLGLDDKSREVSTCTISMGTDAKPAPVGKTPKYSEVFAESFDFARKNNKLAKDAPVEWGMLRTAFAERAMSGSEPSAISHAFKRCVEWAVASGSAWVFTDQDRKMISDQRSTIGEVE